MNAILRMDSIFTKKTKSTEKESWLPAKEKPELKTALAEADRKLRVSEKIKADALAEDLDDKISKELDKNLKAGLDKSAEPLSVDLDGKAVGEAVTSKPLAGISVKNSKVETSETILELKRKQAAIMEIQSQIRSGATLFDNLARQSEQISSYLAKAELEITSLERIRDDYQELSQSSKAMAKEYGELKEKTAERVTQIALLTASKQKDRDALAEAKVSASRFEEELRARQTELQSRDIIVAKLKDQNLGLSEKIDLLSNEKKGLMDEISESAEKVANLEVQLKDAEKKSVKQDQKLEKLVHDNEQSVVELQDLKKRYASLNTAHTDMKSELEEVNYKLVSDREDFDEKLRLKDSRIVKLEHDIELLTRQVCISETMVADLKLPGIEATKKPMTAAAKKKAAKPSTVTAVAAE